MSDVSAQSRGIVGFETFLQRPAVQLYGFAVTLFLSALLLFSVQPMFAKMALPALGGSPSVWAVSMCFFQAALLAGYGYAHLLNRWLSPERAVLAHIGVLALTVFALPIGLPSSLTEPPTDNAYLWLAGILTLGVGLPFFAVSASAPLLQAWFARTDNPQASDPYFLYGASNIGSLLALLSYPVLLEPTLGLKMQAGLWGAGFSLLAVLVALSGCIMLASGRSMPTAAAMTAGETNAIDDRAITLWDRVTWTLLALVPSGLMVAVTTYMTTDIASAPFLWVIPLALFLVTFILVFRDTVPFNMERLEQALPALVLAVIVIPMLSKLLPLPSFVPWKFVELGAAVLAFFAASLVCHRQLYNKRPAAKNLTEFYIWMSFGGVLGGIFAAIIAPQIFISVIEFTLLLLASLLARRGVLLDRDGDINWRRVAIATVAVIVCLVLYKAGVGTPWFTDSFVIPALFAAVSIFGLLVTREWTEHRLILVIVMMVASYVMPGETQNLYAERSFFGTVRVKDVADGEIRAMYHGTTLHGARRLKDAAGQPVAAALPSTYYHAGSPMALGLVVARSLSTSPGGALRVGVVGLGTGSLSCYRKSDDAWRYYEIDPVVVRIARDPKYFDFLSRCSPQVDVKIGDARLTLAKEPVAAFDYLVIDAFSSDTVPVHLLTAEALKLYMSRIGEHGIVALHVSNRYMDLATAVAATAGQLPGVVALKSVIDPPASGYDAAASTVMFLSRDAAAIAALKAKAHGEPLAFGATTAWTDDYSDVVSAIARRHGWR